MPPKSKSKTKPVDPAADLTFEQAKQELETIVRQLEEQQLPLAEALALFERGQALAARCGVLLNEADLKIKQLVPKEGGYALEPFEAEA